MLTWSYSCDRCGDSRWYRAVEPRQDALLCEKCQQIERTIDQLAESDAISDKKVSKLLRAMG